jgi:hypothetical protein
MADAPRKKSPRAPTMALDEALERAMRAYDKEHLHAAPTDIVAQNLGYKGVTSGTALAALASLRYYGLLERPSDGLLAVSKDVEAFRYSPSEDLKRSFLFNFLRKPTLFAELLDKYPAGLPSDANLKYELLQRGFLPATASSVVAVFRRSVEFSDYFGKAEEGLVAEADEVAIADEAELKLPATSVAPRTIENAPLPVSRAAPLPTVAIDDSEHDRIPVRLSGGRRAWLSIPTPFFMADKQRLKAQIDLLLTAEDDAEGS